MATAVLLKRFTTPSTDDDDDHGDDHSDGVKLLLCTAATRGPIRHPPGDIWACRTMVEWYWQGKTPDSSAIVRSQSYQQSRLVAKFGGRKWCIRTSKYYLCSYFKVILRCGKMLHEVDGFTSLPKVGLLRIFIAPKYPSPRKALETCLQWQAR
jgi:hypothetical protein